MDSSESSANSSGLSNFQVDQPGQGPSGQESITDRQGASMAFPFTLPTAFELQVRKLGLDERTCAESRVLRLWCEQNKDRYYVPEWLLAKWGISVEPILAPDCHHKVA